MMTRRYVIALATCLIFTTVMMGTGRAQMTLTPTQPQTTVRSDQFLGANKTDNGQNKLLGSNSTPPCQWTPAATVTPDAKTCATNANNGVSVYYVTLNQNTTLACPTNLPTTDGFVQTYRFQQPAITPYFTVTPNACYKIPGGTFSASGSPSAVDQLTCTSFAGGTEMDCGQLNVSLSAPAGAGHAWLGGQSVNPIQLVDATSMTADLSKGNVFYDVMSHGAETLNVTNIAPGGVYTFYFKQGGAGSNTLTLSSAFNQPSCTFTLSTTVGVSDRFTIQADPLTGAGNTNLSCGQFQSNVGPPTISNVTAFTAASTIFKANTPNAPVGTVAVNVSSGAFDYTQPSALTITGANTCGFHFAGSPPTQVQAKAAGCAVGTYSDWNVVATGAGFANSPFTQAEAASARGTNIVNHAPGTACASSGAITCSTTMNVTSGDLLIVGNTYCLAANCATTGSTTISSIVGSTNLGTCTLAIGARQAVAVGIGTEIWTCPITGTGSSVVTATYSANVSYGTLMLVDVSGVTTDDGVGNAASGTGATPSVTTKSATTQANEFIFAVIAEAGLAGLNPTAGVGYTIIDHAAGAGNFDEYSSTNTAGSNTASANLNGSATSWFIAVAAFR